MNFPNSKPIFGADYDVGCIGFTFAGGFVSTGVAWFERWNRLNGIRVTHTLIVSGEDECIEAHIDSGVARAPLTKYFNDPACRTFFRRPRGWTPALGRRIVDAATARLGDKYDTSLIFAQALADTFAGHLVNQLLRGWPNRRLSALCGHRHCEICSELVAAALDAQPEFHGQGVLHRPLDTIDPQELFEDNTLFEPWPPPSGSDTNPMISPPVLK